MGQHVNLSPDWHEDRRCKKGLVLVCAEMGGQSDRLTQWAERSGAVTMVVPPAVLFIDWMRNYGPQMDLIFVDGTGAKTTSGLSVICEWLRMAIPDLPIVMVSDTIAAGQFIPGDSAIGCDAVVTSSPSDTILDVATTVAAAQLRSASDRARR